MTIREWDICCNLTVCVTYQQPTTQICHLPKSALYPNLPFTQIGPLLKSALSALYPNRPSTQIYPLLKSVIYPNLPYTQISSLPKSALYPNRPYTHLCHLPKSVNRLSSTQIGPLPKYVIYLNLSNTHNKAIYNLTYIYLSYQWQHQ